MIASDYINPLRITLLTAGQKPYDSGGGEYTGEASVIKWKLGSAKENSRNQPFEFEISAGTLFT